MVLFWFQSELNVTKRTVQSQQDAMNTLRVRSYWNLHPERHADVDILYDIFFYINIRKASQVLKTVLTIIM